jgi:hypothetical protein
MDFSSNLLIYISCYVCVLAVIGRSRALKEEEALSCMRVYVVGVGVGTCVCLEAMVSNQ